MPLFLLFLAVPLVEIALFVLIGGGIGVFATLAMVVVTAIAGSALLRWQGVQTLNRIRTELENNRLPARPIADGAMIAVAGLLLLTPGFFTDTIGFILLVPPLRALIGWRIWQWMRTHGSMHFRMGGGTVDGNYRDVSDQDEDGPGGKGGGPQILPPASDSRWGRNGNGR